MRLRRLLVLDRNQNNSLIFSRTFYVSEALTAGSENYCTLPEDSKLISTFLEKYLPEADYTIKFKPTRDSCDRTDWAPVFSLLIEDKLIWPVVFITTSKYILIGVPLMSLALRGADYIAHPEIPAAIELLDTFANFLKTLSAELSTQQFEMDDVLNFVAPYGLLTCTSVANFKVAMSGALSLKASSTDYLQSTAKQAPVISISIKETVKGVIYNRKRNEDKFDFTGVVLLTSTLPVATDVSANLVTTLDITHVVPGDKMGKFNDTVAENRLQIFLTPGYDTTEVFKYCFEQVRPPISGTYRVMASKQGLDFTLDLRFFPEQKMTFDYIEVTMPFPNRGPITSHSYEPQSSSVHLNRKKEKLIWKYPKPPATEKLSIHGSIVFDGSKCAPTGHPQLIDINAYADVKFKCSSATMSKMRLEQGSVTVFPTTKFKLNYTSESVGNILRIWNILGEVQEN